MRPSQWLVRIGGWTLAALLVAAAQADTIVLKDGGSLTGEIIRRKPDLVVIDLGFTVLTVPLAQVARIDAATPNAPGDATTGKPLAAGAAREVDIYLEAADREELSVNENVRRCGDAVVEVRTPVGLGSGFLISTRGLVVTNHHVIAGEHKITVSLYLRQGRDLKKTAYDQVKIVAMNPEIDLALLQLEGLGEQQFPALPLADSDALKQGQEVFAIGSPLGLDRSVSQGIVSSKNRPIQGRLYIQTTTQINPGNSGGPLFNLRGEVVGVTNMKVALMGVEGVGFAIPSNTLKSFLRNRDAFAFDPSNPNAGFRYYSPPLMVSPATKGKKP